MNWFLIWSIEHDAWWGPDRCGYETHVDKAGRYPRSEAVEIVAEGNIAEFNECMIPVAYVEREHMTDEIDRTVLDALVRVLIREIGDEMARPAFVLRPPRGGPGAARVAEPEK